MRRPSQRRDPAEERQDALDAGYSGASGRPYPHDVPDGPERRAQARELGGGATGHDWTDEDVEEMAQSLVHDRLADYQVHDKIGPFPPDDFLEALGHRVWELTVQMKRG